MIWYKIFEKKKPVVFIFWKKKIPILVNITKNVDYSQNLGKITIIDKFSILATSYEKSWVSKKKKEKRETENSEI